MISASETTTSGYNSAVISFSRNFSCSSKNAANRASASGMPPVRSPTSITACSKSVTCGETAGMAALSGRPSRTMSRTAASRVRA